MIDSSQVNHWLSVALKPALALFVLAGVGAGVNYYMQSSKEKARLQMANELYAIQSQLSETPVDPEAADKKKADLQPKKDLKPIIEQLKTFAMNNAGERVALQGILSLKPFVGKEMSQKDWADTLEKVLEGADSSSFLTVLVQDEMATALSQSEGCKEAVGIWSGLLNQPESAPFKHGTQLKMGYCYEQLQDFEQAKLQYQSVSDAVPNSMKGQMAKKFLLHLQMKQAESSTPKGDKSS